MNMTPAKTADFIKELAPMVAGMDKCDIVLCVPYVRNKISRNFVYEFSVNSFSISLTYSAVNK